MGHQTNAADNRGTDRDADAVRRFEPSNPAPTGAARAVLIVDPDTDTRNLYACFLKLEGCDVEMADDGRDALAKALTRPFDVIVTETRLPGFDGYQLSRLLRDDAATRNTPILFVTADARASHDAARAAGVDELFVKPCLPDSLVAAVRRVTEPDSRPDDGRAGAPGTAPATGGARRLTLTRAHRRGKTTRPPIPPPTLHCPFCTAVVTYDYSYCGGVNVRSPEQWDYVVCPSGCGTFEYRHRTRKLRVVNAADLP